MLIKVEYLMKLLFIYEIFYTIELKKFLKIEIFQVEILMLEIV